MILLTGLPVMGMGYFHYSSLARTTYDQIMSLRFDAARSNLVKLRLTEPENLIVHSLENYMDCLSLFIGEHPETYELLKGHKYTRLEAIEEGDRSSPYYLYLQADIHLQWAITRVKFEDYFRAVLEIKKAFKLLERNAREFPDFLPTYKNLGLLHALIGTVPDQYRWGLKLLGMSGTITEGKSELQEVLQYAKQHDFIFHDEIYVMYSYLLLHLENDKAQAWETLQEANLSVDSSPLVCFVMANMAMQTNQNDKAIAILKQRPTGSQYLPFPYLYLMEGIARLNRMEASADQYLMRFLKETRGIHYIKEAYQKLSWYAILFDKPDYYQSYVESCKKLGTDVIDEDKTALHEAKSGRKPDKDLLAARLLFDGGYYDRASTYLDSVGIKTGADPAWLLEYHYRLGRIYHELGEDDRAISYYDIAISEGKHESTYYACNASIMKGIILENKELYEAATKSYELALSMHPDEYQASLHQKAKAGLQRIRQISP